MCRFSSEAMMNETLDLLRTRRSVAPHLLAEPGPDGGRSSTLLLTIAARVPDHGRLAPWRFIVIEGEARHRIGEAIAAAFRADEPGGRRGQGRGRAAAPGPRAARRRRGVARPAARQRSRNGSRSCRPARSA